MADSRYVIELILNARDNTAGAFQKALGEQKKFIDQQEKDNKRLAKSVDELAASSSDLKKEEEDLLNNRKSGKPINDETLKAQENLSKKTKEYIDLKKQVGKSDSEQELLNSQKLKALKELKDAENGYATALRNHEGVSERASKDQAKRFREKSQEVQITQAQSEAIRGLVVQREAIIDSVRKEAEVAKKTKNVDKDKHDQAMKNIADLKKQYESLKTTVGDTKDANDRLKRAEKEGMSATKDDLESLSKARQRYYDNEERRQKMVQRSTSGMTPSEKISFEIDKTSVTSEAEAAKLQAESIVGFIETSAKLDWDQTSVQLFELEKKAISTPVTVSVKADPDRNSFARAKNAVDGIAGGKNGNPLKNLFTSFGDGLTDSSAKVSKFSGTFRGLLILGVIAFIGQLTTGVFVLAGALTALVSSALSAAGALGGALVAGIGQALPAVGVLAAFGNRVSKVFGALKQSNLEQQQASYSGASAADTQAKSLSGVADAQKALTEARKAAKKALEDLIFAEKGQVLSVEEAGIALNKAVSTGGSLAVSRAQLGVEGANRDLAGTRSEISSRKKSGIEGSPEVVAALKNLEQAKQGSAQAGTDVTAAAGKLNFLLAGLSASEVKLYKALMRLQTAWRKFASSITAPLTDSFTFAVNKVVGILDSKQILNAGKKLSEALGSSFTQIFDALFSKDTVTRFLALGEEFAKNLKPITGIAISLLNIFLNFAEAGGPALSLILGYLNDIIGSLNRWSSSIAGKKSLTDFFTEGSGSLKGVLDLLMAIGNVILAIMGPAGGIKSGNKIIQQMITGLNSFAEAIKDPTSRVGKFFDAFLKSGEQLFPILGPLLASLGNLIEHMVSPQAIKSLQDFIKLIEVIIIPALKTFITWMQLTISAFTAFMSIDLVSWFTKTAIAGGLLLAVVKRFSPIYHGFKNMANAVVDLQKALKVATAEQVAFNEAASYGQTGGLIGPPTKAGATAAEDMAAASYGQAGGLIGPRSPKGEKLAGGKATRVLRKTPVAGKLLMGAGMLGGSEALAGIAPEGSAIASVGSYLAPFAAVAAVVAVIVGAVVGLLAISGRLGDVWKAIKDTFNGVFKSIKKALGELAMEVTGKNSVKEAFAAVVNVLKIAGNILADVLIPAIKVIGATIGFLIITPIKILTAIIRALRGMIEGLITYFSGIIDVVVGIFTLDPQKILGGLKKVLDGTVGFFKSWAEGIVGIITAPFKVINDLIDSIGGKADSRAKSLKNNLSDLKVGQQKTVSGSVTAGDVPPGYEVVSTSYGKGGGATVIRKIAETRQNNNIPKASGEQRRTPGKDKSSAKTKVATKVDNADATSFLNTFDPQTVQLSDAIVKKLSRYWNVLRNAAKNSVNDVIDFLKDLRGAQGNGRIDKFVTSAVSDFKRLRSGVRVNMVGVSNIVKNQMQNSMNAVHDAAVYMKKTLNDALKAVGADKDLLTIKIGAAPKVTGDAQAAATGGWIGNRGERGQDAIHTVLGRGEAVLNWGHQKVVEPALRQVYGFGLDEMFGRTRSLHAGTGGTPGGRASGGRGKLFTQGKASWFGGPNDGMNIGTATGVPDTTPGIALYNQGTKNKYFNVYAPNGRWHKERQIDIGPAPWTGKILDITSAALSHFGFNEGNFPTGVGNWRVYGPVGGSGSQSGGGEAEILKMPKITGANSPMGQFVSKGTKKMIAGAQKYLDKKAPVSDGGAYATQSGSGGPAGLGNFDGFQIAKWIIPILTWARQHGWKGSITSGYRSHAHNVAQGRNYHSNHEDTAYPGGAIDVGGYGAVAEGQALANVLKGYRGPRNLVWGAGIKDYGHFSARGNAQGGFVGLKKFADGGHVDGPMGQAVPIVAHAGEWVVNKMQQAKLAMMAGTTPDRVKGALGFGGGPNSFAKGGEVKELTSGTLQAVAENAPSKLKDFTTKINQAFNETFSFIDKQINKNLGNLNSKKFSKNLESMLVSIRKLTNDGGALDALALRITRTFDLATTSANLAIAGFVKVGNKLKKVTTGKDFENAIDPEKIATAEALLQKELQDKLIILRTEWVRSLARINKIIKQSKLGSATRINDNVDKIQADIDKLEKGDENADQKKKIKKLEKRLKEKKKQLTDRQKLDGEKNTAEDKIKGIEDQISETESKQVELKKTAFEERTKADTKTSDATIKQSAYLKSVGELLSSFGGSLFGQTGQDLVTKSLADNKQAAIDRQAILVGRLEKAKADAAADPRLQSLVDDLADQVNEANLAVLQATADVGANAIAVLQKGVEDKIKAIDTRSALNNVIKSVAELLGTDGTVKTALESSLTIALDRQSELQKALDDAKAGAEANPTDPRWKELVTTLNQQLQEAGLSVYEANAAIIQNSIDAAEKVFQGTSTTGEFMRGIKERGAALAERMGNRSVAFANRQSNLAGRGADLEAQRKTLSDLIGSPELIDNTKQLDELRKKIAELDMSIAENTQETKDLSLEYRKSQVDLITGKSDRSTGLIGSVGGILANIARATGSSQSLESQIGLAQQIKAALGLEQGGLADQISQAIADQQLGSEANAVLAQLQAAFSSGDPASFAATLAALSPTISELESTLGVTAAGTFQTLINAMISNTTATTDNTANLAELNGLANQPQQFATTAWTKFRTALFNGVGDILPQFQIPQMETGGYITKGGMFNLHPGEFVVNATQSNLPSDSPINITVNEANKPLDVTALASRIAFEKRTRR